MSDYELELEVESLRRAVITLEQKVAMLEEIARADDKFEMNRVYDAIRYSMVPRDYGPEPEHFVVVNDEGEIVRLIMDEENIQDEMSQIYSESENIRFKNESKYNESESSDITNE